MMRFLGPLKRALALHAQSANRSLFDFQSQEQLSQWVCTSDKTIGGSSSASLEWISPDTARFSGYLSLAKGPDVLRSGYCALRTKTLAPSSVLAMTQHYDLTEFDSLDLVVRGDGRTYIVNIQTEGLQLNDMYQCFVYTRGGPEWQRIRLPFQDFLLTHLGFVQNIQKTFSKARVTHFGLLLADRLDGPFCLDIRSISAHRSHPMYFRNG
jgi:NADH dehydrogenase [ubiquinone] 1 alpha subcomplex assembly factor 1